MPIFKSTNKSVMMPSAIWRTKSSTKIQCVQMLSAQFFEENKSSFINFISFAQERLTYFNLWKISQQTINNLEVEINQYIKQSNNSESLLTVRWKIKHLLSSSNFIHAKKSIFIFVQLKNQIRASEQKIVGLKDEIDSGKLLEMSLAKSRSLCEAQMKMLDKKYNGKKTHGRIQEKSIQVKLNCISV